MKKRRFIILGVILLIICFVSAGTLVWYLCDGRYINIVRYPDTESRDI